MCSFPEKKFFFVHMRKFPHSSNWTWKLSHTFSDGFTSSYQIFINLSKNWSKNVEAAGWYCYS